MNILVVDDNTDLSTIICEHIGEKGHHTHSFDNPIKAVEWLQINKVDMIISDYSMPLMNGLEFRKEVFKMNKGDIPFILFSGENRTFLDEIKSYNLYAFVPKGDGLTYLEKCIDEIQDSL